MEERVGPDMSARFSALLSGDKMIPAILLCSA